MSSSARITADNSLARIVDGLTARLTRVTASGDFIPEVDGLRFLAIVPVVLHHLMSFYLMRRFPSLSLPADWESAGQASRSVAVFARGYHGVHVFFVISGFVLALPFVRHRLGRGPAPRLRAYYLRRIRRIEPPYLLALTLGFVIIWLTNPGRTVFIPHLAASAL